MLARIERDPLHEQIFSDPSVSNGVVLDFPDILKLADAGIAAKEYLSPEIPLASTTTVHDSFLHDLHLTQEENAVRTVEPDWHFAFDVPTYRDEDMASAQREQNIDNYRKGVSCLYERLKGTRTTIVPLLKAVYPEEIRDSFEGIKHICDGVIAVYVGQFFGPHVGNRHKEMERWIWQIDAICNPSGIILIGLLSPRYLAALPGSVIAAIGKRYWMRKTEFRTASLTTTRRRCRVLQNRVQKRLSTGYTQQTMSQFTASEVHADG